MKKIKKIFNETEKKSISYNESISKKIILELEKIYNIHFPILEYNMTYNSFIPALLFDCTYMEYRDKLIEILEKYNVNWKDIVFSFLAITNQEMIPDLQKRIAENGFKTLPYCKKMQKLKNGYIIETKDGIVEAYQLSKMINHPDLYRLLKENIFCNHCHEAVEICKNLFIDEQIITSELEPLFGGVYYHSYYKNKEVIDISSNLIYKNNTFDTFYKPKEIQCIPTIMLDEHLKQLPNEKNDESCKVLRLAINNKIRKENKK